MYIQHYLIKTTYNIAHLYEVNRAIVDAKILKKSHGKISQNWPKLKVAMNLQFWQSYFFALTELGISPDFSNVQAATKKERKSPHTRWSMTHWTFLGPHYRLVPDIKMLPMNVKHTLKIHYTKCVQLNSTELFF